MTLNFYLDDTVLVSGASSAAGLCPMRRLLELLSKVGLGASKEDEEGLPEQGG